MQVNLEITEIWAQLLCRQQELQQQQQEKKILELSSPIGVMWPDLAYKLDSILEM